MTSNAIDIDDRYPTRVQDEPAVLERPDPTVWSGLDAPGPMTHEELTGYQARGFHIMAGLLSPEEIESYRVEFGRLAADPGLAGDERTIVDPETREIRAIYEVHKLSPLVAALAHDPRLRGRAEQVLGSPVYVLQSRMQVIPAFEGNGFYWHSDFETWHAEDGMPAARALSFSVTLTRNYPFNGGLMLMPGSHRRFVSCAGATPEGYNKAAVRSLDVGTPDRDVISALAGEFGIEQFTGDAGSAMMFDCNTMHGSGNNITPYPRSNIYLVYNSVDNALREPYAASAPRPEFVAGREATALDDR